MNMILLHATGINETDLLVLESHAVYSLSKEKTAVRFYIMQCAKSVKEDVVQIPIKDAIERFWTSLLFIHLFFFWPERRGEKRVR